VVDELKIAQLATFKGNIGDNANIMGMRNNFHKYISNSIQYTNFDIMDYLWNKRNYDEDFISNINKQDMFVVGGGGFFELTEDNSCSGTPINIPLDVISKIKTPIIFHGLGIDVAKGYPERRLEKFKSYLGNLIQNNNVLISVRNDGAMLTINNLLGTQLSKNIHIIPDGGFFINPIENNIDNEIYHQRDMCIGVNIAGDMPNVRFNTNSNRLIGNGVKKVINHLGIGQYHLVNDVRERFLKTVQEVFLEIPNKNTNFIFFPHMYKDTLIIAELINRFPSEFARRKILVAPCITGNYEHNQIFNIYRRCDLVLGMRFHSNVCPIGMSVPTLGISSYPQIDYLYEELGIAERCLKISKSSFRENLYDSITKTMTEKEKIVLKYKNINKALEQQIISFYQKISEIIRN
jgi:polysaccharide pyruvyl transferase WcaK-like protein